MGTKYQIKFDTYEIDVEQFYGLKVSAHIYTATYFRLLVTEILPKTLDKVISLDSDLIVNGSLNELFNIDVINYALAAYGGKVITTKQGLRLEVNYSCNAGVMLINLDYWLKNNVRLKAI
ncbi:MAG: hypothetical protein HRU34_05410 [Richelia sp.]|nr:hypothetical protein [Richelia sp.]